MDYPYGPAVPHTVGINPPAGFGLQRSVEPDGVDCCCLLRTGLSSHHGFKPTLADLPAGDTPMASIIDHDCHLPDLLWHHLELLPVALLQA